MADVKSSASPDGKDDLKVDEDLYSRQLYVIGHDAMKKMMEARVLIVGMDGLGQEIAKNIALAGVKHIEIYDTQETRVRDLCSGYYISKDKIGIPRAQAVLENLKGLNKYVSVNIVKDTMGIFKGESMCNVIISVNQSSECNLRLSEECHKNGVKFISTTVSGLFSQIFVDLNEHVCLNKDGLPPSSGSINDITVDGILTVVDGIKHNLEDDDVVRIDEIEYRVKVKGKNQIQLENYRADKIKIGGDFEQIIMPLKMHFKTMEEYLSTFMSAPESLEPEIREIHNLFIGEPCDNEDLQKEFDATKDCLIAPMCSIVGGIVSQEIIKAITGKFNPIKQFHYFRCLNKNRDFSYSSQEDRYYDMKRIFGEANFEKLANLRIFLVGAGAIGCENMKNYVMSGIGSKGMIYLTDMDAIEHSNLNRQFLFKESDVSQLKSESAALRVLDLNEDFPAGAIKSYSMAIGHDTEHVFSDKFFEKIDLVSNALDNIETRNYMDDRCVKLLKPMFDAGTLGTKGHVQCVLPGWTESYSSSADVAETSVPMCTIKSHPTTIEHTIEWALGVFREKFSEEIQNLNNYLQNGEEDENTEELLEEAPRNVEMCIKKALGLFVHLFSTTIQNLLSTFPADYVTKDGLPYWSPPKRPPSPISFNVNDKMHVRFVDHAANLFAKCYGVRKITHHEVLQYIENVLCLCEPNPIKFSDEDVELTNLEEVIFEKDSWHSDFIFACANLRARNYKIKEQSKHFIKGVAGKITPAIATTTAVVSGLEILEIVKYALFYEGKDSNINKNAFLDLGMPFLALIDCVDAPTKSYEAKSGSKEFTLWSRKEYEDCVLKSLIDQIENYVGKSISMLSLGSKIVFWPFCKKYEKNLEMKVSELADITDGQMWVFVDVLMEDDSEIESIAVRLSTSS